MAIEVINRGTSANDGTGDNIREAFRKVNDNFDQVLTNDTTDYTDATTPLAGTEIALVEQGGTFKKVAVSEFGGGKSKFIIKDFLVATNLTTTWRFRAYASATSYTPTVLDSGQTDFLTALTGSGTSSIPYQTHNSFVAPFDVKLKSIEVFTTNVFGSFSFSLGIGSHLKNDDLNTVTDGVSILEVTLTKSSYKTLKKKYTPVDFGDVTLLEGHSIVVGWINQGRGIELYFEFEEL